jgi:hypothetical protein
MQIRVPDSFQEKILIKILLVLRNILILIFSGIFVLSIIVVGLLIGVAFKNSQHIRGYFRNSPQSIEMEWLHVATDENEVEDDKVE